MATQVKSRAAFFSMEEQEVIMREYEEIKTIIVTKSNTATAARARQEAWQDIANILNARNPAVKRTWEQVKIKHKNIITTANKKRAAMSKTGGGLHPCEELALQHNRGRPIMEGIAGGSSSAEVERKPSLNVAGPSGLQPPPMVLVGEEPTDDAPADWEETLSALSGDVEYPAGPYAPPGAEAGPSDGGTGDGEAHNEDIRSLYKRHLLTQICVGQLQIKKLWKEIKLLDRQLGDDQ